MSFASGGVGNFFGSEKEGRLNGKLRVIMRSRASVNQA